MYISKLRGPGESVEDYDWGVYESSNGGNSDYDWGSVPDYPVSTPTPTLPVPSDTGPTQWTDWINMAKGAIKTYGDIERSRAQVPQAPQIVPSYPTASTVPAYRPLSSPFSAGVAGNGGTLLLLAAAAAAAFAL